MHIPIRSAELRVLQSKPKHAVQAGLGYMKLAQYEANDGGEGGGGEGGGAGGGDGGAQERVSLVLRSLNCGSAWPAGLGSWQWRPARSEVQMRESVPRSSYQSLHALSHATGSPTHASFKMVRRKRSCVFQNGSDESRVRRKQRSMSLGVSTR